MPVQSSEGYSGVNVWRLDDLSPVGLPCNGSTSTGKKNIYSASAWIYFEDHSQYVLLLGSLDGRIVIWDWSHAKSVFEIGRSAVAPSSADCGQVTSIDVLQPSFARKARVAAGRADGSVAVWNVPSQGDFVQIFTVELDCIPRTVAFDTLSRNLGYVAMHQDTNRLAASTAKDFRIFQLRECLPLITLKSNLPVVTFPKQVAFIEAGTGLVVGSDVGTPAVYNVKTGKVAQILKYPRGGLVQTIAAARLADVYYVAVAGSAPDEPAEVLIWRTKRRIEKPPQAAIQQATLLAAPVSANGPTLVAEDPSRALVGFVAFLVIGLFAVIYQRDEYRTYLARANVLERWF
ncbi:hypothetical protein PQX77_015500 [Marasmius sp. AFHP31]|nr:hypothetical protein PQX77_015500 [Marasmius sp. AFHP31]